MIVPIYLIERDWASLIFIFQEICSLLGMRIISDLMVYTIMGVFVIYVDREFIS